MKVISARDLLLADPLVGMNQFDLCSVDNLDKVNAVLAVLGFDTSKAVHIYAANHRDMKNHVEVGYIFAGEMNLSREHIKGPYARPDEVMLAAQMQDKSLYEELHAMSNRCNDYGNNNVDSNSFPRDNEQCEEEMKILEQINQLEEILFHIRGSQRNPDGSIMTAEDYKQPKQPEQGRLRRKSIKKQQGE